MCVRTCLPRAEIPFTMKVNSTVKNIIRPFAAIPHRLILTLTDINLISLVANLRGIPAYIKDWITYSKTIPPKDEFRIDLSNLHPCLGDRYSKAGTASGDYFHQDLCAARKVFIANPENHWDISSRIDGFVAHLLTFRSVNVIDIRPMESKISEMIFHQGDITALNIPDNSIEFLSCLHIGLGRYGDSIDPFGCFKGMSELQRILAPSGKLYFSVPIGVERVEFNGHRVFNPMTIIETFSRLSLIEFTAVDGDTGDLLESVKPEDFCTARWACGLFIFEK